MKQSKLIIIKMMMMMVMVMVMITEIIITVTRRGVCERVLTGRAGLQRKVVGEDLKRGPDGVCVCVCVCV